MADVYKVLGQSNPSALTDTTLYTVPSGRSAIVSTLSVTNLSTSTTYRIAIRVAGAAITPKQYIVYNAIINSNDAVFLTLDITLGVGDIVSVYAGTSTVSFNLFGHEIA